MSYASSTQWCQQSLALLQGCTTLGTGAEMVFIFCIREPAIIHLVHALSYGAVGFCRICVRLQ